MVRNVNSTYTSLFYSTVGHAYSCLTEKSFATEAPLYSLYRSVQIWSTLISFIFDTKIVEIFLQKINNQNKKIKSSKAQQSLGTKTTVAIA